MSELKDMRVPPSPAPLEVGKTLDEAWIRTMDELYETEEESAERTAVMGMIALVLGIFAGVLSWKWEVWISVPIGILAVWALALSFSYYRTWRMTVRHIELALRGGRDE